MTPIPTRSASNAVLADVAEEVMISCPFGFVTKQTWRHPVALVGTGRSPSMLGDRYAPAERA